MSAQRHRFTLFVLLVLAVLVPVGTAASQPAVAGKSIVIHQLKAISGKDISYLQEGVRTMLASRLAADSKVKITQDNGADYQVDGTLTTLGGATSLDLVVTETAHPERQQHFYATAPTEGEIIIAVDTLARQINENIFHGTVPAQTPAAPSTPAAAAPETGLQDTTAHPERAFLHAGGGAASLRPGRGQFRQFVRSQTLTYAIQSMAVGDIDGDGQDDFILAQPSTIKCYHMVEQRLQQFAYYPLPNRYKIIHVSLADFDGDGRAEIYLSSQAQGIPLSMGLRLQEKGLTEQFRDRDWFIRAINDPLAGLQLVGQRYGSDRPLEPGIFELQVQKGRLTKTRRLDLPKEASLYAFTSLDIDGDGRIEVALLDDRDRLTLYRSGGAILWRGAATYGGSPLAIGKERDVTETDMNRNNALKPEMWSKVTVPPRMLPADLNGDGIMDLIVCRNNPRFSRIVANSRSYDSTELYGLAWNGVGLDPLWGTKRIDGFITNIALQSDSHNQPRQTTTKLHAALVLPTGIVDILSRASSTVLTFNVDRSVEN